MQPNKNQKIVLIVYCIVLIILIVFLTPWKVINLSDYNFITHEYRGTESAYRFVPIWSSPKGNVQLDILIIAVECLITTVIASATYLIVASKKQ